MSAHASFPRKREAMLFKKLGPGFRGGDVFSYIRIVVELCIQGSMSPISPTRMR
jgi:hypothetical protein